MIVVIGGGLSGLSAGLILSRAGRQITVIEKGPSVGGLSRTINHNGFSFDLGGHRFLTKNKKTEQFVKDVLKGEYLVVQRKSRIYMLNRYFDYPLKPLNAFYGLGFITTLKITSDYLREKAKNAIRPPEIVSLEDWVISQFGRKMFEIYFKQYSEKVWGIDCSCISKEWVAQRINGLSLWKAVKNAFLKFSGREIPTLSDKFIYPKNGIGQIAEGLKKEIENRCPVLTDTKTIQIYHEDFSVISTVVKNYERIYTVEGSEFISSIPVTNLVQILQPAAPDDVIEAANKLNYRDLIVVTIMLNRERITDLTWMYLPEKNIPIGRIHEPKNWSPHMADEGKTHIVAEYFCFKGDRLWSLTNEELTGITIKQLGELGFINENEVIDSCTVRVPNAYPLFDVGYRKHYNRVVNYLDNFKNLHIIGRGGMFSYLNMDHAIETGIEAAEDILNNPLTDKKRESLPAGRMNL